MLTSVKFVPGALKDMSEKKIVVFFAIAILAVGIVWLIADQKYNTPVPEPVDVSLNLTADPKEVPEGEILPPGSTLPPLAGDWLSPDSKSSAAPDLAGKAVIVDIWSTFCGPCVAAIPTNNLLIQKYAPQGLVFAGVSPEPRGILADFKTKVDIQYPLLATSEDTLKTFKIEFFPSLFLFDKSGKLVWQGSHILNKRGKLKVSFSKALKVALGDVASAPAHADSGVIALPAEFEKLVERSKEAAKKPLTPEDEAGLKIGASLPPLEGTWIAPGTRAPDLKNKILLLDFFTTECGSCVASLPFNNKLYARLAVQGFVLVNATPEDTALIEKFKLQYPIDYPVLTRCNALFKICEISLLPTTLLFDRQGKLIWKGERLDTNGVLDAGFEKALNAALSAK